MRKSAILFFLLVLVITVAPQSHAAPRCIRFPNFCNSIVFDTSGSVAYGNVDFECDGNFQRNSLIGNAKGTTELATRPLYSERMDEFDSYAYQFYFKPGKLFDMYASGGTEGQDPGLFLVQSNQPYTVSNGACRPSDIDRRKPSLSSLLAKSGPHQAQAQTNRCMHFTNFCDTIEFAVSGDLLYGDWDWLCTGDYASNMLIGNLGAGPEMTGRPGYGDTQPYPYSTEFSFKPGKVFDLYLTQGVPSGVMVGRKNQPYTITAGSCSAGGVDKSKPRMMDR